MRKIKTMLAIILTVTLFAGVASAGTIGMEAEWFDSETGDGFDILSDTDAGEPLGGEYITTGSEATASPPANRAIYNFNVDAADAGSGHNLYMRVAVGSGTVNDDSIFVPGEMGSDPSWVEINSLDSGGSGTVYDVDGNATSHMSFFWINLTDPTGTKGSAPEYTLASGANTFELGGREDGFRVDAMVFSTDINETSDSLDNAVIPEPATLAFLGLGGLLVSMRRRRR